MQIPGVGPRVSGGVSLQVPLLGRCRRPSPLSCGRGSALGTGRPSSQILCLSPSLGMRQLHSWANLRLEGAAGAPAASEDAGLALARPAIPQIRQWGEADAEFRRNLIRGLLT